MIVFCWHCFVAWLTDFWTCCCCVLFVFSSSWVFIAFVLFGFRFVMLYLCGLDVLLEFVYVGVQLFDFDVVWFKLFVFRLFTVLDYLVVLWIICYCLVCLMNRFGLLLCFDCWVIWFNSVVIVVLAFCHCSYLSCSLFSAWFVSVCMYELFVGCCLCCFRFMFSFDQLGYLIGCSLLF